MFIAAYREQSFTTRRVKCMFIAVYRELSDIRMHHPFTLVINKHLSVQGTFIMRTSETAYYQS
jgi:hypothetical protein